jgi:hypothetical protein
MQEYYIPTHLAIWLTGCSAPAEIAAALLASIVANLATPQLSALFVALLKAARKVNQGTAVPMAATTAASAA